MPQYDSSHTGEQVDEAVDIVLGNKSKGSTDTPVYLNANGEAVAVTKDTSATENSTNLITSGAAYTGLSVKLPMSDIDTNTSLGNSDTKVPSSGAVEGYVDGLLTTKQDPVTGGIGINVKDDEVSVDTGYERLTTIGDLDNKWEYFPELKEGNGNDLVAKMEAAKRSTFDKSKFTVVGSPVISEDGIASGFSVSNYVVKNPSPYTLNSNSTLEFYFEFTTPPVINNYGYPLVIGNATRQGCALNIREEGYLSISAINMYGTNYESIHCPISGNTTYKVYTKATFSGYGKLYSEVYSSTGMLIASGTYNGTSDRPVDATNYTGFINIGTDVYYNAYPFLGSIDLKQFSIIVDGQEVFSGNKTGIDTIKPNDYTVVGSPTISADGILTATNGDLNYIQYTFSNSTFSTMEYTCKFRINALPSDTATFFTIRGFELNVASDGAVSIWGRSGQSETYWDLFGDLIIISGSNLKLNTWYSHKLIWDGTTYYIYLKEGNGEYVLKDSKTSNVQSVIITGRFGYNGWQRTQNTSIDLNEIKYFENGDLVYQPCLKIPYTLTSQGNKIVDAQYKGRVEDEEQQAGYTPYDVLETETTEQFTKVGDVSIVDGVASGLDDSNYITAVSPSLWADSDNWHIKFSKYCGFDNDTVFCMIGDFSWGRFAYSHGYNSILLVVYTRSGEEIVASIEVIKSKFSAGVLDFDIYYSSQIGYYFTITQGTTTYTSSISSKTNKLRYNTNDLIKFKNGSINLNAFKIYIDGKLVYTPYKKPYYELATTKEANVVSTYTNASTQTRKFANQFIKQQGACTADTAVTLPTPFIDTNYFLSVPYSAKSTTGFTPTATGDYIAEGYTSL